MPSLSEASTFQIAVLGAFGAGAIIAVIIFAWGPIGSSSEDVVKLDFWGVAEESVIKGWLEENFEDNKLLEVEYTQIGVETFEKDLWEAVALGRGPDIVLISQDQLAELKGIIFPISFSLFSERQFRDTFVDAGDVFMNRSEGFSYGLPVLIDPMVMYWNRTYVRDAGFVRPPDRWSGFGDFVLRTTRRDRTGIVRSAVALGEYRNIEHSKALLSTLIFQAGGRILEGDIGGQSVVMQNKFGQPIKPAISSLLFYTDFSDSGKSVYTWNRTRPNSFRGFVNEELVVYFGLASDFKRIKDSNPFLDFDVALVPQSERGSSFSYSHVSGLAIMNSSRQLSESFGAVMSLTSASSLRKLSVNFQDVPPSRRDVLNDPPRNPFHVPVFYDAAVRSISWVDPLQQEMDDILREMVESIVDRRYEVDYAVDRAISQIRDKLK